MRRYLGILAIVAAVPLTAHAQEDPTRPSAQGDVVGHHL